MPPVELKHLLCLKIVFQHKPAEFDVVPVSDCLRFHFAHLHIQSCASGCVRLIIGYLNLDSEYCYLHLELQIKYILHMVQNLEIQI